MVPFKKNYNKEFYPAKTMRKRGKQTLIARQCHLENVEQRKKSCEKPPIQKMFHHSQ